MTQTRPALARSFAAPARNWRDSCSCNSLSCFAPLARQLARSLARWLVRPNSVRFVASSPFKSRLRLRAMERAPKTLWLLGRAGGSCARATAPTLRPQRAARVHNPSAATTTLEQLWRRRRRRSCASVSLSLQLQELQLQLGPSSSSSSCLSLRRFLAKLGAHKGGRHLAGPNRARLLGPGRPAGEPRALNPALKLA